MKITKINTENDEQFEMACKKIFGLLDGNQELFLATYFPSKDDIDSTYPEKIKSIEYYQGDYEFYFISEDGNEIENYMFVITKFQ
ncbi:MAG: hypothetical protein FWC41_11620 [Firmicutes bacterium]|nr:hypothetical protein [Bacillota bacterium]